MKWSTLDLVELFIPLFFFQSSFVLHVLQKKYRFSTVSISKKNQHFLAGGRGCSAGDTLRKPVDSHDAMWVPHVSEMQTESWDFDQIFTPFSEDSQLVSFSSQADPEKF